MKPLTKFYRRLLGGGGIVGILFFFLIFSCSQKLPTSPIISQAPNPRAGMVSTGPAASVSVSGNLLGNTVGKLIGWLGGELIIPIENTKDTSLLVIPQGSLLNAVYITASARFGSYQKATFYNFGPDRLVFLKPVSLVHRAREPDGAVLILWYFNPDTRQWEKSGSATVIGGVATFPILHFSNYAVTGQRSALSSGGQQ